MKKKYERPDIEVCEFVVAARLAGSGPHSNGQGSTCTQVASSGINSCALPSLPQSNIGDSSCYS